MQGRADITKAQALNNLRLRVLQAKAGFLALGTTNYMAFIDAQAVREGVVLTNEQKSDIRQVFNCRLSEDDAQVVDLIERSLKGQQVA